MTVFLSYILSFTFALIYGPYLFVAAHVWPAHTKAHHHSRLASNLLNRQDLALWSQLLFGLAIATACVVRRQREALTSYENTTIISVTFVNFGVALITWPAIFHRVTHTRLFAVLALTQICLSWYLATTLIAEPKHWAILDGCALPIGRAVHKARVPFGVANIFVQGLLLAAWVFLFSLSGWGRSRHPLARLLHTRADRPWC